MATITPRGKYFLVSAGSGAARKRVSAKTMDEAHAKAADLDAALRLSKLPSGRMVAGSHTLQDAYEATERTIWRGTKGHRTTTLNARGWLEIFGADTALAAITYEAVADAVYKLETQRENTGATINRKLAALSRMLRHAVDRRWLASVPALPRKREGEHRICWFDEADERAMIDTAKHLGMDELARFIPVAIHTGFRRSELLQLHVTDHRAGMVMLHAGATKNGRGRSIPATSTVAAAFEAASAAGRAKLFTYSDTALRADWERLRHAMGRDGDAGFIVHALRHTTATRLAIAGAVAQKIMAYMGHSHINTSMRYIHLAAQHLQGMQNLLERAAEPNQPGLRVVNGGKAA